MKNEPVAWMQVHYKDGRPTKFSKVKTWEDDIPLYTHPAKTLTDEEIVLVWNTFERTDNLPIIDFAKAILRKAQE
jgi:hypothetical protein